MHLFFDTGWVVSRIVAKVFMGAVITGRENVPDGGGFILASNHISYIDPPLVGCFIWRRSHFFAKKELFDMPILGAMVRWGLSHPVRRGGFDRGAITTAVELVKSGHPLVVFPEGTRARHGEFLPAKAGVGRIARECEVPVAPCYIEGADQFWKCFFRRRRLKICYGSPLSVEWIKSVSNDKEGWMQITSEVMKRIRLLKEALREGADALETPSADDSKSRGSIEKDFIERDSTGKDSTEKDSTERDLADERNVATQ